MIVSLIVNPKLKGFKPYVDIYDPIKVSSIDGKVDEPHDKAIVRALAATYKHDERVVGDPLKTIFIARLDANTTEETLKNFFMPFGRIKRLRLVRDIITGFSKKYAFIEFAHRSDAIKAVEKTHGRVLENRKIFVDFECERTLEGWKPRRLGGGFGGNKHSGQLRFGCKDRPFRRPITIPLPRRYERDNRNQLSREVRHQNFKR